MPKDPKAPKFTNPFDLPEDRLASTTETGKRVYLYPAAVKGFFRTYRTRVYAFLVFIFLIMPWLKLRGHQAILLDIADRKFAIFGLTFWAHELPILFLVLFSFVILMGLVTALLGRIWCGWACPETVFVDLIYRRIEEWIEGSPKDRRKSDLSPLSFQKLWKKTVKWALYLLVSLLITHSFLAYFVGAEDVIQMVQHSPKNNPVPFLVILFTTAIISFVFGWFREQFCIIACPYGRFQSVMMDPNSLVVGYDKKRGEPRLNSPKETRADAGDCINCYRCVQVCPTGIDIRRGTQMECIMCTACIDACDQVMHTLHKPKGLIRYTSENALEKKPTRLLRTRVLIYIVLLAFGLTALSIVVYQRDMVHTHIQRYTTPPYEITETGITNRFKLTIKNQYFEAIDVSFALKPSDIDKGISLVTPTPKLHIQPGKNTYAILFITFPKPVLENGKTTLILDKIIDKKNHTTATPMEVGLIGPF